MGMASITLGKKQNILKRLSKNARISLRNASLIMEHLKAKSISPEHIFIGILLNEDSLATRTISSMNIDRNDLMKKSFGGKMIEITTDPNSARELEISNESQFVLRKAYDISRKYSHVYVGSEHIMEALLQLDTDYFKDLIHIGLSYKAFKKALDNYASYPLGVLARPHMPSNPMDDDSIVDFLGIDLVELAKEGRLDPVLGREAEINQLINILSRRKKNNPIIVGEAGVGKTVLVEGLAERIALGHVPPSLRNMRIVSLDIASIMAGSKMRGDVEEKIMSIVDEVISSNNTILFIDEIHNIVAPGMSGGPSDIGSVLKPALLQEDFRCIGATTIEEYSANFESDSGLARRFQPIRLEEATQENTLEILQKIKPILERHHNVSISKEALRTAVTLSNRYVSDRYLPDKAIDLLDEAAASKRLAIENEYGDISELISQLNNLKQKKETFILKGNMPRAEKLQHQEVELEKQIVKREKECTENKKSKKNQIDEDDIRMVVSKWTGIPLNTLGSREKVSLLKLEKELDTFVVGQKDACRAVAASIKRARTGISDSDRPWASFLFLGPTGVGKTELAKVLTKQLFGNEDRLVQIDMSEMMEMHSVSKLIGSPPGYVGFQQGGMLTEQVRRQPHSVILFDEIEKAHPDVLNVLLQILEYGHLTDGRGRKVNFKNTIIILTSNIGAEEIKRDKVLGFVGTREKKRSDIDINKAYSSMKSELLMKLKDTLRPELLNRIDDIVIFRSLTRKDARKIVELLINDLNTRLVEENIVVEITDKVGTYLVKEGFSDEYGARPLRRRVQDSVENVLADYILSHKVAKKKMNEVTIDMINGKMDILTN
ncbi:MAG: ATPase AAA-2 domain protein [candidate division WS6 bacterium GW2011_GWC2_36_7]|uniref:ATPase AAA-2 domain protein n=1 Tax=candidate division WS6 bacterium GW2011_GWC2_36_7 TaxID=1619091 RepID=A0A0G0F1P8_9BACT|nr:MAG: ATPase AAA-2 domain protein [candidate division WS6 bacterium GW2011_GWC2_36_7]